MGRGCNGCINYSACREYCSSAFINLPSWLFVAKVIINVRGCTCNHNWYIVLYAAVFSMYMPVIVTEGVIIDARHILVAFAALFGGWISAIVSSLAVGLYRFCMGGEGAVAGATGVFIAAIIGLAAYWINAKKRLNHGKKFLIFFGFVLACGVCCSAFIMQLDTAITFMKTAAPAFILLYPVATFLIGTLFRGEFEKQQIQKALLKAEGRMRKVAASMPVMLIALDENCNVISWNEECERITGYSGKDILGDRKALELIFPEMDKMEIIIPPKKYPEDYRNLEVEIVDKNEKRHTIAWFNVSNSVPIKGWDDWIIGVDITNYVRIKEQLLQSQKMDAIGQLAGGIAHDFNNQLAGIMGFAEMILICEGLKDNVKRYTKSIIKSTENASNLTKELLAYSRKGQYQKKPIDIHNTLKDVLSILQHSIDKKITLIMDISAESSVVSGDPTQLQNALLNLGINARDAMPDGGKLTFTTSIVSFNESYIKFRGYDVSPGNYILISITDTGIGMSKEVKKHIFEPFYTTKSEGQGTGMGLAAVYGTVKTNKGNIDVYSEPGKGTVFKLYLPLIGEMQEEEEHVLEVQHAEESARILVVDDEESVLDATTTMLITIGYEAISCSNGQEAIKLYSEKWKEIDLVLLDLIMPELGGRQTYLEMQRINSDVKVIICSGFGLNGDIQNLMDLGAAGFLQKPFQAVNLSK